MTPPPDPDPNAGPNPGPNPGSAAHACSPSASEPVTRAELDAREDALLGPWAMRCSGSRGREHEEPKHAYRTTYMRDRDRIIHASAFRRLEYKTQVFVNHEGDYYRTRLTHTMEVAQVARTAARALRLNEDLTESIALSHDLGHGPFGHKGEDVLKDLMAERGGFEHNAHGLRVVDLLEHRYPRWRGLNLCYEVREAFALHSPKDTAALGFRKGLKPLLEAQLVDVCDSLAYVAHDVDDGVASGLVTTEELLSNDLWREHWEAAQAQEAELPDGLQVLMSVKRLIDAGVTDLVESSRARIAAADLDSPEAVQAHAHRLIGFSDAMHRRQRALSRYLYEHFYCHPRLMRMGARARRILTALFEAYRSEPRMLSTRDRAWADEVGLERAICDRLAAMTDRQAVEEHASL